MGSKPWALPRGLSIGRSVLCVAVLIVSGCGTAFGPEAGGALPTLSLSAIGIDEEATYVEADIANDLLEQADFVDLSTGPRGIRGTIVGSGDTDVFDLGPVEPGDRITVTMATEGSLNGAIALFDDSGAALLVNDHRNVYLGRSQPFIDVVARRSSSACYVATTATPGFDGSGDYTLAATKESGVAIPDPRPDVVLLVFDGGRTSRIGGRPAVQVPPFDAVGISPSFAGQTDEIIEQVIAGVREDFQGFNITIRSTSEGDVADGEMTRVLFGTYDAALLGIAEGVDEFNGTKNQDAIVFTDTFSAFAVLRPTVTQISRAITNVASHEIGHLMGLVHTSDVDDIMDVTASLRDLLEDQRFRRAPLLADVFPVGFQDSVQSLLDAVGGDPLLATSRKAEETILGIRVRAKSTVLSARDVLRLSTCQLGGDGGH